MSSRVPMVSVIMPAHNAERHIARAVRSILNQKPLSEGYELIVINDGSTDNTSDALKLFSGDINFYSNDIRKGLPSSLNRAIRQARGKYVVRVDADDYVSGDYLYILHRFLEANHHMDAVACDYNIVDDNENVLERKNCLEHPIGCGIMFRTAQLIDIGLYDSNFLMHEDADLRIRFLQKHSIFRIELPLYRYRRHETNMTNNRDILDQYAQRLTEKHGVSRSD